MQSAEHGVHDTYYYLICSPAPPCPDERTIPPYAHAAAYVAGLPEPVGEAAIRRAVLALPQVASASALGALLTGRQVRLPQNRNVDMAMCGGRCETEVRLLL